MVANLVGLSVKKSVLSKSTSTTLPFLATNTTNFSSIHLEQRAGYLPYK
jgi:hypothetical protein